jgi:prevent-host-death family protein
MHVTVKDLCTHTKKLINTASNGEEVIITYRGKPYVKLISVQSAQPDQQEEHDELFGIWKDRDDLQDVTEYVNHIRKGRFA